MINLEITIIMKTKIAVKIAIAVTCTIAFMMGFFIKLNQFRIQSNRYSNSSIISPPFLSRGYEKDIFLRFALRFRTPTRELNCQINIINCKS